MFNKGDSITWNSIDGTITYKGEFIKMVYHGDREFLQIQNKDVPVIHEIENTKENIFNLGLDNSSSVKIKVGQRYLYNNNKEDEFILAQVESFMVSLINLNTGNRWNNPVRVMNWRDITPEEFELIRVCGNFKLKEDV